MIATQELSQDVGVRRACAALSMARATFYRQRDGQRNQAGAAAAGAFAAGAE